jgi:hypothetical protein
MADKIANFCRIVKGSTYLLMGSILVVEGIGSLTRAIRSHNEI